MVSTSLAVVGREGRIDRCEDAREPQRPQDRRGLSRSAGPLHGRDLRRGAAAGIPIAGAFQAEDPGPLGEPIEMAWATALSAEAAQKARRVKP